MRPGGVLTIFFVKQYLELVVQLVFEHMIYSINCILISKFSEHEGTSAGLLHYLRPVIAGDFAKGLVAVHYGKIHYLCVG